MSEFCTAEETAARWGISARRVQNVCADGRIEGAKKLKLLELLQVSM